jgi:hypothetical protein
MNNPVTIGLASTAVGLVKGTIGLRDRDGNAGTMGTKGTEASSACS